MCCSTCFGRLHVHHQELTTPLTASGFTLERGGSSVVGRGIIWIEKRCNWQVFFLHVCISLTTEIPTYKKLQDPHFATAGEIAHSLWLGYWLYEGKVVVLYPVGKRDLSVDQVVQARSEVHTAPYILRARTLFPDLKRPNIWLITLLHLVPDLLMSGNKCLHWPARRKLYLYLVLLLLRIYCQLWGQNIPLGRLP